MCVCCQPQRVVEEGTMHRREWTKKKGGRGEKRGAREQDTETKKTDHDHDVMIWTDWQTLQVSERCLSVMWGKLPMGSTAAALLAMPRSASIALTPCWCGCECVWESGGDFENEQKREREGYLLIVEVEKNAEMKGFSENKGEEASFGNEKRTVKISPSTFLVFLSAYDKLVDCRF